MLKNNKAITLVALVMTIVLLLLLAGITISSLTGENGILNKVNSTKSKTIEAKAKERIKIEVLGSRDLYGNLDIGALNENLNNIEGIKGLPISQLPAKVELDGIEVKINNIGETRVIKTEDDKIASEHNWVRTGDKLTCKCENCINQKAEGITFEIGEIVDYSDTGIGSSTLDGEKSGVSRGITKGDLNEADFGTDGEQIIAKDDNTTWVVLGVDDIDNNNINETLLLTSEKPTTTELTLYGGNPYKYEVDKELDRICKEIYGENARSIDADDVNTVLEYSPPGGIYYPSKEVGKYLQIGNFTTKVSDLTDNYYNLWDSTEKSSILISSSTGAKRTKFYTPEYPDGTSDENELGKYEINGYWYLENSEIDNPHSLPVLPESTSEKAKKLIFGDTSNFKYYLGNRGLGVWINNVYFGLRKSCQRWSSDVYGYIWKL